MHGRLINGTLYIAPKDLVTDEGKVILDFDTNEELMKQMGYKLVVRNVPEYDSETQSVTLGGYTEDDNTIAVNYIVITIPVDPKEQLKAKIKELEDESNFLKDCLLEMSEVVYGG